MGPFGMILGSRCIGAMGRTLDRRRLGIFRGALDLEAAGSICFSGLDISDKVLLGVETGLAEASVSSAGT